MDKYFYLGNIDYDIPIYWRTIVEEMLRKIDKISRSKFIPRFILNWVKYFAMGGSSYITYNKFWYWVLLKINYGIYIHQIKQKYGELNVLGTFSEEVQEIVKWAIEECSRTCEHCGSVVDVKKCTSPGGYWISNLCSDCRFESGKISI